MKKLYYTNNIKNYLKKILMKICKEKIKINLKEKIIVNL